MEELGENLTENSNRVIRSADMEIDDIVRDLGLEHTFEDYPHLHHNEDFVNSSNNNIHGNNLFYQFPLQKNDNNNITTIDISSDIPSFIITPPDSSYNTCLNNFSFLDKYSSSSKLSTISITDDSTRSSLLKTSKNIQDDTNDPVYIKTDPKNLLQPSQIQFYNDLEYNNKKDDGPNLKYLEYLNLNEEPIKETFLDSENIDKYSSSSKLSTISITDDSTRSSLLKTSKNIQDDTNDPVYIKTDPKNLLQPSQIQFYNVLEYNNKKDDGPNLKYLEYLNLNEEPIKETFLDSENIGKEKENRPIQKHKQQQPQQEGQQQPQWQELPDLHTITPSTNNFVSDYNAFTAPANINNQNNGLQPIRVNNILECNKKILKSNTNKQVRQKQLKFTYRAPLHTKSTIKKYGNVQKTHFNSLSMKNDQKSNFPDNSELATSVSCDIEIPTIKDQKNRTGRKEKLVNIALDDGLQFFEDIEIENQIKIQKFTNNHDDFVTRRQFKKPKYFSSTPYKSPPKFSPKLDDAVESSSSESESDILSPSCLKCTNCQKLFKSPRSRVIHQKRCIVTFDKRDRIKEYFDSNKDLLKPTTKITEISSMNQPKLLEKRVTRSVTKSLVSSITNIGDTVKSVTDSKIFAKQKSKKKMFSCTVCDKKFRQESYFKVHLQRHNNTFSCEYCFKSFSFKKVYDDHLRLHCEKIPPIKRRKLYNTRNKM